jgi:hypothetical protein
VGRLGNREPSTFCLKALGLQVRGHEDNAAAHSGAKSQGFTVERMLTSVSMANCATVRNFAQTILQLEGIACAGRLVNDAWTGLVFGQDT